MKTNLSRLATLVVALFVTSSVSTSWGQGKIYTGIVAKPTTTATINGIVNAIRDNNPQAANWNYITNGSTIPLTQIFNYGTTGSGLRYSFAFATNTTFMLTQVEFNDYDPVFGASSGHFTTYNGIGYGINFGPDGVLGGNDDTTYNGNNGSALVNAVYLYGLGLTIDTSINIPISDTVNSWKALTYYEVTYSVLDQSQTSRINFSVPEPSSATLILLGLLSLHTLKKKK